MQDGLLYEEKVVSPATGAFFLALAGVFALLRARRLKSPRCGLPAGVHAFFTALFLFYALNYRELVIQLTARHLKLSFGVFTWTVPLENVAGCALDELPPLLRYGGAGIHFMFVGGRYRASFNFLEYPRVVVALKHPAGPVRDISFSTRRPEELLRLLRSASCANRGG